MKDRVVAPLSLVKTHAFGNDFLLLHRADVSQGTDLPGLARAICNRHWGLGADGLMLIEPTSDGARTQLLNADGSAAEVSGNGVRCAAAWVAHERRLRAGGRLVIETAAGPKRLELLESTAFTFTFRAEMGPPTELREETLDVDGTPVRCVVLRVGNPQCVVLGPVTVERLQGLASKLAVHPFFPEGTNVELATVESPSRVRILIWERGVGPTEASGTGACASAVAAAFAGGASRMVEVASPGGSQHVEWTDQTIWLTGWATVVGRCEWWGA
ncbi:MAG: diaminopimelate epimerase [Acidobacteriota bacterium]